MIKGMIVVEMPENCRDCDFFGQFCKITGTKVWYDQDGRVDDCPIQEYIESNET